MQLYFIQLEVPTFSCGIRNKGKGDGYRNMSIVIFERECKIIVCNAYVVCVVTFAKEQKADVSIIMHVINVSLVPHWQG